jgi:SOS response regulatory protein OraA/RecX
MPPPPNGVFSAALAVALKALAASEKFRAEIGGLLERKGFDEPTRLAVIEHLGKKKLFDDLRCAELAVRRLTEKGAGPEKIRLNLEARGADAATIEGAMAGLESGVEQARKALIKRFREPVSREKAARFLALRGFSEEAVENVLDDEKG